jgi:hypothetical protein
VKGGGWQVMISEHVNKASNATWGCPNHMTMHSPGHLHCV